MKFTEFLKTQGAIASIIMGIFFAVGMLGIFLTGYKAIPENIDQLPIAIVNEDKGKYGEMITEYLSEKLPFEDIATNSSNEKEMDQLEDNELSLVIRIPATFSTDLEDGNVSSSIDFTVNGAGPSIVSSTMSSVVTEINNLLSAQFSVQTAESIFINFDLPEEQAKEMATMIQNTFTGNVVTINDIPEGMNNTMVPMFLALSGYVGAMIAAMQLVSSFKASRGKATKTRLFVYVQLTALLIAFLSSLTAVGITFWANDLSGDLFFSLFGQQMLNYMVSFNFAAVFIFLIGAAGMIVNMPILLMQTLANGAVIPRSMMFAPYEWMSYISPLYYSVQAYFAQLYGSVDSSPFIWKMVLIGVIVLVINIFIVWIFHKPIPWDVEEKQTVEATI